MAPDHDDPVVASVLIGRAPRWQEGRGAKPQPRAVGAPETPRTGRAQGLSAACHVGKHHKDYYATQIEHGGILL